MAYETLRVESNERIDHGDFDFAVAESLDSLLRRPGEAFYSSDGAALRSWILDGFTMSNPSGKQLEVTKGRAILPARINGTVEYGYLLAEGDLTKSIDMAPLTPTGVYNVYVRFEMLDSDNSSRIFWDPSGSGSEFPQTIPTRRQANWSMRVETSNPGAEWLQIGTADNSGGSLAIVNQHPLYFEGAVHQTYQSGWSTDGGGGANDRNANRQQYGVKDLQAFGAAIRQCLEDLKGRGLRRWWARDIGGMNIGFDAAPVEDRLAVGDGDFGFNHTTPGVSSNPEILFGSGNDRLLFNRANNYWEYQIGGALSAKLSATGLEVTGEIKASTALRGLRYLYLGTDDYIDWDGTNWRFFLNGAEEVRILAQGLIVNNGLFVGDISGVPTDNQIEATGALKAGTYLQVGTSTALDTGDGNFAGGLAVGYDANPTVDTVSVGDGNFRVDGSNLSLPAVYFDSDSSLEYFRSGTTGYRFRQGGSPVAWLMIDPSFGASVKSGCGLFDGTLHNPPATGPALIINANTSPFCIASCSGGGFPTTPLGNTFWNVASVNHSFGSGTYYFNYTNPRALSGFTPAFASAELAGVAVVAKVETTISQTYLRVRCYDLTAPPPLLVDCDALHIIVYDVNS